MSGIGRQSPKDRIQLLTDGRRKKMARSAHAYVRGNTAKFYEWLASGSGKLVPKGPPVWICGDCHVGNLGPVASAKGRIEIQIRDLDQTVIGNPAHDLIRLGLSLAMAARGSNLPGTTTAHMLENMVKGYELGLSKKLDQNDDLPEPIELILEQAFKRRWRHLAEERIKDVSPSIPIGRRFWQLTADEDREIARLFQTPEVRTLITSLQSRDAKDEVKVVDAAYWLKGCSSLGKLRYAVLIRLSNRSKLKGFCLFDMKESVNAIAPRDENSTVPRDNAKRVVEGARHLSPFLGNRMLPARFLDRAVVLRELLPQDLKLEMESLNHKEAIAAARFLASVVGKAHARQMDDATREGWLADLGLSRSKTLDAPSWLWTSVVELVASHEMGYLEHCRKYILPAEAS